MAATAQSSAPQTEPFPALDTAASSAAVATTAPAASDASKLLRPAASPRPDTQTIAAGLSPKSEKLGLSPQTSSVALTGAAAMAELKRRKQQQQQQQQQPQPTSPLRPAGTSRQTTPNPAVEAVQSLLTSGGGMSKPSDAPAADKISEPLRKAAEKMHVSDDHEVHPNPEQQASPVSLASFGTAESSSMGNNTATAPAQGTSPAAPQFVAEPAQMTDGVSYQSNNGNLAPEDQDGTKAFSYPGPPQMDQMSENGGPSRGMSLPGYGQTSPKSPASNKRHKCPYCATDFTRHHNLKSHLLTHSQEKPYVCQTCQARFRRLHDLKRHTKLHTGERPHTCDKCGRRFARGDALARHNKGPGGCAGRRASFGGDDEYGSNDDPNADLNAMDVDYTAADDDDDVNDAHERRISEPTRKRQQLETAQDSNREVYRQQSKSYPPAPNANRAVHGSVGGGMGPPSVVHPGQSSPHDASGHPSPAGGSSLTSAYYGAQVFAEPAQITHSPKPLSPGQAPDQHRLSAPDATGPGTLGRNRSTSLTTQFQQAHFGRSSGGRTPPPSQFPPNQTSGALLPPLSASTQSQPRGLHSSSISGGTAPNMAHHQQIPHSGAAGGNAGSNPGSLSSQGRSSASSMRDIAGQDPNDVWTYVRSLEQRFSRMQDEYELRINRLQEDVINLKQQVSNTASYSSEMGSRY